MHMKALQRHQLMLFESENSQHGIPYQDETKGNMNNALLNTFNLLLNLDTKYVKQLEYYISINYTVQGFPCSTNCQGNNTIE